MNNIALAIKSILARYDAKIAKHRKEKLVENLCNSFYLDEVNGRMYIMCNGIAVEELYSDASVSEALDSLATARKVAQRYEGI